MGNINISVESSFIVEEVFQNINKEFVGKLIQNTDKKNVKYSFNDFFGDLLWSPCRKKIISIDAVGKNDLKKYILLEKMYDTDIKDHIGLRVMSLSQFWAVLYLIITEPKFEEEMLKDDGLNLREYIFHIKIPLSKVFCVSVTHSSKKEWYEWRFNLSVFDYHKHYEGSVFLFF